MKEDLKFLDWIFKHESEIAKTVETIRRREISIFNNSHLHDPTASKALRTLFMINSVKIDGRRIHSPDKWLEVISATYESARQKNQKVFEIAKSRYRDSEYCWTTQFKKLIGRKTYYRLLTVFLKIAQREARRVFEGG